MSTATTDRPEQAAPNAQRDAKGRFARNNDGGPGNPFGRRLAELRKVLLRSATEENVERLANMLMEKAFAGDLAAAKLLLLYWIGKPKEVAEPDRVDVDEWELARQTVVRPDIAQETFASLPITIGIAALPALAEARQREAVDMLRHPEKYQEEPEDELTPEELAEEAEMLREMRAAREAEASSRCAPSAPKSPPVTAQPVRTAAAASHAHPQADESVALSPTIGAASGVPSDSPSPNGGIGRRSRLAPGAADPACGSAKRAG
jgi:hypothetical protein